MRTERNTTGNTASYTERPENKNETATHGSINASAAVSSWMQYLSQLPKVDTSQISTRYKDDPKTWRREYKRLAYAKSPIWRDKQKRRIQRWKENNPENYAASKKRYVEKHREYYLAYQKHCYRVRKYKKYFADGVINEEEFNKLINEEPQWKNTFGY